jgi:tetratricopeptide (TPR) repeat protein
VPSIKEDVPLRESRLWDLQLRYFERLGEDAWGSGSVPAFPTSNTAIATACARVIAAWVRDTGCPAQVVELGAGHGRFGYRCVRALRRDGVSVRYTFTDVAQSNIDAIQRHPMLQEYFAQDIMTCARQDAATLPDLPKGPLVVVANYCFDSLLTDVFRVKEGRLEEGRPILSADVPISDDPSIIDELDLEFSFHPIDPIGYYGDPMLDELLAAYQERMGSGVFCFPIGTLRGLKDLLQRPGPVLLLATDKGHSHIQDLVGNDTVGFATHGSFSFMVNFDAVTQLFQRHGGRSHCFSTHDGPLEGGVFIAGQEDCTQTVWAFQEHLAVFSPSDFYALYQTAESADEMDIDALLAMLRLSRFDPQVYTNLYEKALDEISELRIENQRQVLAVLDAVWESAFPIGGQPDVAFALGRTLHQMSRYQRALDRYTASLAYTGEHPATRYNMGLCLYWQGQDAAARVELLKALELDPAYGQARDWLVRIDEED